MFTPICIPDKHTCALRTYVNPMGNELECLRFIDFLCLKKKLEQLETNNLSRACPCRIEKSYPRGRNLTRDSASLIPGSNRFLKGYPLEAKTAPKN